MGITVTRLRGRLTKKGKTKSDKSQNGVTSLYMYISISYFVVRMCLGSATCVPNFIAFGGVNGHSVGRPLNKKNFKKGIDGFYKTVLRHSGLSD